MEQHLVSQSFQHDVTVTPAYSRFAKLEAWLETYLVVKAPYPLSQNWKENLPKFFPWAALVFAPVMFFLNVVGMLMSVVMTPFAVFANPVGTVVHFAGLAAHMAITVLTAMSVPGLFRRQQQGWVFASYAQVLSLVWSVCSFDMVGIAVHVGALYMLFQIKQEYRHS